MQAALVMTVVTVQMILVVLIKTIQVAARGEICVAEERLSGDGLLSCIFKVSNYIDYMSVRSRPRGFAADSIEPVTRGVAMKLVGIMSLTEDRTKVRDLLRDQGVQIYSEIEILGHSTESIATIGWFATSEELPEYASLCFAIVQDDNADSVFAAISALPEHENSDHPIRAFLVPVERMI